MTTVFPNPLNPGSGRKRFFDGREGELLAFLSVKGNSQAKAAKHFGCNLRTVEAEIARLRKAAIENAPASQEGDTGQGHSASSTSCDVGPNVPDAPRG